MSMYFRNMAIDVRINNINLLNWNIDFDVKEETIQTRL